MGKILKDFTKVEITDIEGKVETVDVSKVVGNFIYGQTSDIGMMDLAREIYHKGKIEMDEQEIDYFCRVIFASEMIKAVLKEGLKKLFKGE